MKDWFATRKFGQNGPVPSVVGSAFISPPPNSPSLPGSDFASLPDPVRLPSPLSHPFCHLVCSSSLSMSFCWKCELSVPSFKETKTGLYEIDLTLWTNVTVTTINYYKCSARHIWGRNIILEKGVPNHTLNHELGDLFRKCVCSELILKRIMVREPLGLPAQR